jgi:hypothetical protein
MAIVALFFFAGDLLMQGFGFLAFGSASIYWYRRWLKAFEK